MAPKSELRSYMEANPGAPIEHLRKMFKCSKQSIFNIRNAIKKVQLSNGETVTAEEEKQLKGIIRMGVDIPEEGIILKLAKGKRIVGTLHVTPHGLKFSKSNQKKAPAKWLPLLKIEEISNLLY